MEQAEGSEHERVVALAIDASEHAEKALEWYLCNVRKSGDFLVLIHCPEMYDLTDASPAVADRLLQEKKEQVVNLEKKFLTKLREKDEQLPAKVRTGGGKAGEVVCKIAEEEKATLIVCGTRGQGTIRRTVMGSVSDFIVHHSHVPVLVYRHKN